MKKREIFIELTSLLDVILIMLFVLLSQAKLSADSALEATAQAQSSAAALQQQVAALSEENGQLTAQLEEYQRQELSLGAVDEHSLIITVSMQQTDSGRYILVEQEDGEDTLVFFDAEDENYSSNKLRSTLSNAIKSRGQESVFVVFQYERSSIYQSEYRLIGSVIRELKSEAKAIDIHINYI